MKLSRLYVDKYGILCFGYPDNKNQFDGKTLTINAYDVISLDLLVVGTPFGKFLAVCFLNGFHQGCLGYAEMNATDINDLETLNDLPIINKHYKFLIE